MQQLDGRMLGVAMLLSGLAGYVDAVGFLASGGFFLSFMSGNSTRLGVGLVEGSATLAMGLIAAFVLGVALARIATGGIAPDGGRRPRVLLAGIALVLAASIAGQQTGQPVGALLLVAGAMGAVNLVVERDGDVPFGLTYMTGALVRLGVTLADALHGRRPAAMLRPAMLWGSLIAGVTLGATVARAIGFGALAVPAAVLFILALAMPRIRKA